MRLRGWGRLCKQLALGWLLAAVCAAVPAQAPEPLVVAPGQSATEIALDRVPPGTTIEQFLLALFKFNPQAFQEASLNRLLAGASLRLPSAEEANAVSVAQARAELGPLRQGLPAPVPPAPEPAAPAAAAPALAEPPQAVPAPLPPATENGSAHLVPGLAAAALLALAATAWWHRRRPSASLPSSRPEDAPSDEQERQAQGRFKPVLPDEINPSSSGLGSHGDKAKPALFDLDLNLDGPAPALDLPLPTRARSPKAAGPAAFEWGALSLELGSAPPRASAPGPLDLSGLSLDLDTPTKPPSQPTHSSAKDPA